MKKTHRRSQSANSWISSMFGNHDSAIELNAEELIEEERISRSLHNAPDAASPKCQCSEDESIFEHFLVMGLANSDVVDGEQPAPEELDVESEVKVLFQYPPSPEVQVPGLFSFVFPSGVRRDYMQNRPMNYTSPQFQELFADARQTPDKSFVLTLGAQDSTTGTEPPLYVCCVHRTELLEEYSPKVGTPSAKTYHPVSTRCYCIISRYPYFSLHFEVLHTLLDNRACRLFSSSLTAEVLQKYFASRARRGSSAAYQPPRLSLSMDSWSGIARPRSPLTEVTPRHSPIRTSLDATDTDNAEELGFLPVHSPSTSPLSSPPRPGAPPSPSSTPSDQASRPTPVRIRPGRRDGLQSSSSSDRNLFSTGPSSLGWSSTSPWSSAALPSDGTGPRSLIRSDSKVSGRATGAGASVERDHLKVSGAATPGVSRRGRTHLRTSSSVIGNGKSGLEACCAAPSDGTNGDDLAEAAKARSIDTLCAMFKLLEYYHKTALPPPGETISISYPPLGMEPTSLRTPIEAGCEGLVAGWCLTTLFGMIPMKNVLVLLLHVLLEETVVLVHPSHRVISSCVLGLQLCIDPFTYPWAVIPILPASMSQYLEAPCPLLTGLLSMPGAQESGESALFYNIATKKFVSRGGAFQHSISFPSGSQLMEKVRAYVKRISKYRKEEGLFSPSKQFRRDVQALSIRLSSHMSDSILKDFQNHCIRDMTDSQHPITVFLEESYLAEAKKADQPFLKRFFKTQVFAAHRDELTKQIDQKRASE